MHGVGGPYYLASLGMCPLSVAISVLCPWFVCYIIFTFGCFSYAFLVLLTVLVLSIKYVFIDESTNVLSAKSCSNKKVSVFSFENMD